MSNKGTYQSPSVVKVFATMKDLQKPERSILELLKPKLPEMKMLDLGVGGGRTTTYFAPLTKEYVCGDYSAQMIDVCREKFKEENVSFDVVDARNMKIYPDDSFDFVFFSFNGIDYIDHDGRIQAFREIKRILKPGGFYAFSTHNILSVSKLFRIEKSLNPLKLLYRFTRHLLLRLFNSSPKNILTKDRAIINDGAHNFSLNTYYIKPLVQAKQLEDTGFKDVRFYSFTSGDELFSPEIQKAEDPWIYYIAEA